MKMTMEVSRVSSCKVTDCAYNRDNACHAMAITIGDSDHPMCDTFFSGKRHVSAGQNAGVGACKVSACMYNDDFECHAGAIEVAGADCMADCVTFKKL